MEIVVLDGYTENPGDLSWDAVKSFGTPHRFSLHFRHTGRA